ncbi:EAL domain-containing protein [Coralloluteibacterium stylophorae]|uniref:EAL domain-containing protein n=1 Tax=Coralloluteibacterium stylophorae TaxID=1776034 RepID=A0A8J7VRB3_9GAMM|nr:EAL domain-containing protein [Coralloluteibacterium stylophorae]MBS7457153.1 EAL domain-containing protein [Coralloluteibacterium stylophorae]
MASDITTTQAAPGRQRSDPVAQALAPGAMFALYQPIFALDDARVLAHEALMRVAGFTDSPLRILDEARTRGRLGEVELLAARRGATLMDAAEPGLLFVNLSSRAILHADLRPQQVLDSLAAGGRDLGRYVIELSERDIVEDPAELADALGYLRAAGIRLALDDFGAGHSNFQLWHELAPEFVKLDRFLIDGIARSAGKLTIVKALVEVAAALGAELVAEGIEAAADLELVKDLGIGYAQGFLLGRPQRSPCRTPAAEVLALGAGGAALHPQASRVAPGRRIAAAHLLVEAPALTPANSNDDVERLFQRHPDLHALAVIDAQARPLGLINRQVFNERMARPFTRELHAHRSCSGFMHEHPILAELSDGIADMADVLRGEDQRYLADGFVITDQGRYRGLGTGESLVRRVTELRIEAARYANPLTFLPGNIPITEHIERLLAAGRPFVAAYGDLDNFKPFNDQYGYFRGDRMIRLAAEIQCRHVDARHDFVGHVGGDDFVILFQSGDWRERCERIVAAFNEAAVQLFDPDDVRRGVLQGEDRSGRPATFPLTTLCMGVAEIAPGRFTRAEDVASFAAAAKRRAKHEGVGVRVLEEAEAHALAAADAG